jgi:hypothetical protein
VSIATHPSCSSFGESVKGQTHPFASVESHASFTVTNRHSPRQSSRRIRAINRLADRVTVRQAYIRNRTMLRGGMKSTK